MLVLIIPVRMVVDVLKTHLVESYHTTVLVILPILEITVKYWLTLVH